MAFVCGRWVEQGWGSCCGGTIRRLLVREGEAVFILNAILRRGIGVVFVLKQSDVFRFGARWSRVLGAISGGSLVFGGLLADVCEMAGFVAVAADFS